MKITSVRIVKLFGIYSYHIPVSESGQICLITSPNGYGKTTILSIIDNLFKGYLFYFYRLPFEEIEVGLTDDSYISITKYEKSLKLFDTDDSPLSSDTEVRFEWKSSDAITSFEINSKSVLGALRILKTRLDLTDYELNNLFDAELSKKIMHSEIFYRTMSKASVKFQEFLLKLNSLGVMLISANRIYKEEQNIVENRYRRSYYYESQMSPIKMVSNNLREILESNKMIYFNTVQKFDINLIGALIKSDVEYSQEDYEAKIYQLSSKLDSLLRYGLVAKVNFEPYDPQYIRLLSAYINEIEKKLAVYDALLNKLELFTELIERKVFVNKKFTFTPEHGIRCQLDTGVPVDLDALSSGEQHQLILLFNFIFNVPDKSVLLIDEPENSLHVTWQRQFIEDIDRISIEKDIQVLIATHSPRILANVRNKAFDLLFLNKEYNHE